MDYLGGPNETIKDYIFFTVPSNANTVKNITINFGSDPNWRKLRVVSYGYSSVDHSKIATSVPEIATSYLPSWTVNSEPDANGNVVLNINNTISNGAKYFYIFVQTTDRLPPSYGKAHGFAISSIRASFEGIGTSTDGGTSGGDPIFVPATDTYTVFPSLAQQPDVKVQDFWKKDISSLYYEGSILKSSTEDFLLYTFEDDEFWQWSGSDWINQDVKENEKTVALRDVSTTLTYDCYGHINAVDNGQFQNLNASAKRTFVYDTNSIKSKNISFGTITYDYLGATYSESASKFNLLSSEIKTEIKEVTFDLSKPYSVSLLNDSSVQISSVVTESGASFENPNSAISILYIRASSNIVTDFVAFELNTSAVFYSGSSVIVTDPKIINSYSMINIARALIPKKESITSLDGILLLCDSFGKPIGIPKGNEITSYFGSNILDQERDSRFGFIFVRNTYGNKEGFVFGFYDLNQKEFLGEKVSYVDVISRGINNVYIGIIALDSDGNSQNQIDYIGPKVSTTFLPTDVPIKRICPIYSVAFKSSSAIQIGELGSFVDKKEAWPLMVTSGSFTKNINIPYVNTFKDWKSNYLGQTLVATYDTSYSSQVNWSNIFGRGYYDIRNEKPIIISDRQIKLRQAPFLVWPEPSNYQLSKIDLFIPQFEVFIRKSKDDEWNKINLSEIRDYSYSSGVIEFNKKIVPLDENLIKVNYVKVSSDIAIYQIDGFSVPLNPFLNSEEIKLNKPIYVYAVPTKINKFKTFNSNSSNDESLIPLLESNAFALETIPVSEYYNEYPINYTYNSQIFNTNSSLYDPFALLIGMIYFVNNPNKKQSSIFDARVRGGGIKPSYSLLDLQEDIPRADSNWDIYPAHGTSYSRGGFIIVKIPEEVKNNFNSVEEIRSIIRSNLTAGVSFEIQDLDGKPWEI